MFAKCIALTITISLLLSCVVIADETSGETLPEQITIDETVSNNEEKPVGANELFETYSDITTRAVDGEYTAIFNAGTGYGDISPRWTAYGNEIMLPQKYTMVSNDNNNPRFIGWSASEDVVEETVEYSTKQDGTKIYYPLSVLELTTDTIFTAEWGPEDPNEHWLTYYAYDVEIGDYFYKREIYNAVETVKTIFSINRPQLTLHGWSTDFCTIGDKNATVAYGLFEDITVDRDIDLYAVYEIPDYTVTFNTPGTTGSLQPVELNEEAYGFRLPNKYTLEHTPPNTRFLGWSADVRPVGGSSTNVNGVDVYSPGTWVAVNVDTVFTAEWGPVEQEAYWVNYYIYDSGGFFFSQDKPYSSADIIDIIYPYAYPNTNGLTFLGWSTEFCEYGDTNAVVTYRSGEEITGLTGDLDLYGVFKDVPSGFTATFNKGGASGDLFPIDLGWIGQNQTLLPPKYRLKNTSPNTRFLGWSADKNTTNINASYITKPDGTKIYETQGVVGLNDDTVFTAERGPEEPDAYWVTYYIYDNGGFYYDTVRDGYNTRKTFSSGDTLTLITGADLVNNYPNHDNLTFLGWSTEFCEYGDSSAVVTYQDGDSIIGFSGDVDLYGVFKKMGTENQVFNSNPTSGKMNNDSDKGITSSVITPSTVDDAISNAIISGTDVILNSGNITLNQSNIQKLLESQSNLVINCVGGSVTLTSEILSGSDFKDAKLIKISVDTSYGMPDESTYASMAPENNLLINTRALMINIYVDAKELDNLSKPVDVTFDTSQMGLDWEKMKSLTIVMTDGNTVQRLDSAVENNQLIAHTNNFGKFIPLIWKQ